MGLADLKKKKEAGKPKGLAALKQKQSSNGLAKKPEGLAALRAKKSPPKQVVGLAGLKKKRDQSMKLIAKQDFIREGIKFHNCQWRGPRLMDPICYMGAPGAFWSVDVSNGMETITCHNRWGAWHVGGVDHDGEFLPGYDDTESGMRSPPAWIQAGCRDRYIEELKARKLPNINELRRQREETDKAAKKVADEKEKLAREREARRMRRLQAAKNKATVSKPKKRGRGRK